MSVSAGAIREDIFFRNLGEIWSGPLALCGFWLRTTGFVRFLAKNHWLCAVSV